MSITLERDLAAHELLEISLTASPTRVPFVQDWSDDRRQLGIRLRCVALVGAP